MDAYLAHNVKYNLKYVYTIMASDKFTLTIVINENQIKALNYPVDYVKEEIHGILISYGNCKNIYNSYEFDDGFTICFVISMLHKIYPALYSILYSVKITNRNGETIDMKKFLY